VEDQEEVGKKNVEPQRIAALHFFYQGDAKHCDCTK